MTASEQKPFKLTAPQWRALERVGKAHPNYETIGQPGIDKALLRRELVALVAGTSTLFLLTDLGQRVYARLSVGEFCTRCGKPITFERRSMVPNFSPAKWECMACARRTS